MSDVDIDGNDACPICGARGDEHCESSNGRKRSPHAARPVSEAAREAANAARLEALRAAYEKSKSWMSDANIPTLTDEQIRHLRRLIQQGRQRRDG